MLPFTFALFASGLFWLRAPRNFRSEIEAKGATLNSQQAAWEYRSKFGLFGLPFIHFRTNGGLMAPILPVKAWIASGDYAVGLLFASGNLAIAPVCVGGTAIGLAAFGGCAVGMVSLGGLSLGLGSFGAVAFGWRTFGGCAIAWNAANGGNRHRAQFRLRRHRARVAGQQFRLRGILFPSGSVFPSSGIFRASLFCLAWLNSLWVIPALVRWRVVAAAASGGRRH